MTVIVAKSAGFCFGVQRAVEQVYNQIGKDENIYTYGPIIHNEEVVKDLNNKGVQVIHNIDELEQIDKGTIIIRSHGISKHMNDLIASKQMNVIDATCPFVKRIHNIVETESEKGSEIIIIGNEGHPEVEGIRGWSKTPVTVIESMIEAENFIPKSTGKICIVSQTTFNYNNFQDLVEIFLKKSYDVSVANTICNATEQRQSEAKKIAREVDVMIVIGGTHSSNTKKLFEICKRECGNTYFIQTLEDLHLVIDQSVSLVGITAGASTPNNIIEEVQNYVRINF